MKEIRPDTNYQQFIGGAWVESASGERMDVINPATGEVISSIALGNAADVDKAVKAAQDAFEEWRHTTAPERQAILLNIADAIEADAERFAMLETLNTGKPIRESRMIDIPFAIEQFRYMAAVIRSHTDESTQINGTTMTMVHREPLGVVGQVVPWNFPLLMAAWKIAPALAAGNTVVLKPSELTSITTLELAKLIAGIVPAGVVNIVTGTGPEVGQAILDHKGTKKLAFTGSTKIGYTVAEAAAKKLVPATLELGGKSANIVFDDANWDRALEAAALAILLSQGQMCESGSRLFVQRGMYDRFVSALIEKFESVNVGDPLDETTQMGSQMSQTQLDRIMGYIELAQKDGGTIATGGIRLTDNGREKGFFVAPTIITELSNDARAAQEEIFGPVLVVMPFDSEDEVIGLANQSDYGLAGAVWTQDINRALRVAKGIETGVMWVNTYHELSIQIPFGGYKQSGLGRENHKMILDAYTQVKTIVIDVNEQPTGLF